MFYRLMLTILLLLSYFQPAICHAGQKLAEAPIETLGGLRISTLDQRIRIDHTFEGRLTRLQRKIQLALVERLLPPVGDGLPL